MNHHDTTITDRATYDRARRALPHAGASRCRPSPSWPSRSASARRAARSSPASTPTPPTRCNLFRVHWYNDAARTGLADVPAHVVLPEALTGVAAPIIVALGDRFPMIHAHKVLPAYACLVSRLVTGRFDPARQRALWPSTGNYCRGGVAISRIVGCHGVAILPAGMSDERFDWLERWVTEPGDIIRTPGTESNVREIYDACAALSQGPGQRHPQPVQRVRQLPGPLRRHRARLRACVRDACARAIPRCGWAPSSSASGSAGTLGAGDWLKEHHGAKIVAVEALECPTMLYNGFGEHNIQGIGDKHIPFIHNVMNTDVAVAVSDHATDQLFVLFNDPAGHALLRARGVGEDVSRRCRTSACRASATSSRRSRPPRRWASARSEAILTVATDGAAMYSVREAEGRRQAFRRRLRRRRARPRPSTGISRARRPSTCW